MNPVKRFRQLRTLRGVPPSARLILYALTSHADEDGDLWISQGLLSKETGLADRTLRTWLRWLARKGLLIEQRHGHKASSFRLTVSSFIELAAKPVDSAERIRQYRPTEVTTPKKAKPRKSLIDSPRFDASAPPDRRCPTCGAAAANLERGGYCFLHRAKAHGQL